MSQLIDMSSIAAPTVVESVVFDDELTLLLDYYTDGMREENEDDSFPRPLVSDPAYQILSTVAYRMGLRRQEMNDAAHAVMLAYSTGSDLDQIGLNYGVTRLEVTPADDSVNPSIPAVLESDARFRERIQLKLESITTAGSVGAYEYHVLSVSTDVVSVFIDHPTFSRVETEDPDTFTLTTTYDARLAAPMPGDVSVTVLLKADANVSVLDDVEDALNADYVRPITDRVNVVAADVVEYQVEAVVYSASGPSSTPILEAAELALETYTAAQYKLGSDIALSALIAAAHQPGAQRVEVNITGDIVIEEWQAARCTSISVTAGT